MYGPTGECSVLNITLLVGGNAGNVICRRAPHFSTVSGWASIPKVVGSIPTVARHIFQAYPVRIHTQSNITNTNTANQYPIISLNPSRGNVSPFLQNTVVRIAANHYKLGVQRSQTNHGSPSTPPTQPCTPLKRQLTV